MQSMVFSALFVPACLLTTMAGVSSGGDRSPGGLEPLPEVRPVDMAALSPEDFTDEELGALGPHQPLPYYLVHLHRVANAVRDKEPARGFIDIHVWRRRDLNTPHNARVMENITSLAFFYTAERPWNPYYGDEALRKRLEAAMYFWTTLQDERGMFSKDPTRRTLAATSFGARYMAATLHYLQNGPPIDAELHARVTRSLRRAIMHVLQSDKQYAQGRSFANQYGSIFSAAAAFLDLYPEDDEMREWLYQRIESSAEDLQSPAGYFYEEDGPCFQYDIGTHLPDVSTTYHFLRDTPVAGVLEDKYRLWIEWIALNAPPEPDGARFVLNRAIEMRLSRSDFTRIDSPLSETVETARAFASVYAELQQARRRRHDQVEAVWPDMGELGSYVPSAFGFAGPHHPRRTENWYPDERQRQEAIDALPCNRDEPFAHQRSVVRQQEEFFRYNWFRSPELIDPPSDRPYPHEFTYIRQPGYYAVFNAGRKLPTAYWRGSKQRFGMGLLWHPDTGTAIQSQSGAGQRAVWGTVEANGPPSELKAVYTVAGRSTKPGPGAYDLPSADVEIAYELINGHKTLKFLPDRIEVQVNSAGTFREHVPLRVGREEDLIVDGEAVTLQRGEGTLFIEFSGAERVERLGSTGIVTVRAHGRDRLSYVLAFRKTASDP